MSLPESSASCWLSLRRARCLKHPRLALQTKLPAKKHHKSDAYMHLSRRHANACNLHGYRASSLSLEVSAPESVTKDNEPSGLHWFASHCSTQVQYFSMSTLPLPIAAFVAGLLSFLSPCV